MNDVKIFIIYNGENFADYFIKYWKNEIDLFFAQLPKEQREDFKNMFENLDDTEEEKPLSFLNGITEKEDIIEYTKILSYKIIDYLYQKKMIELHKHQHPAEAIRKDVKIINDFIELIANRSYFKQKLIQTRPLENINLISDLKDIKRKKDNGEFINDSEAFFLESNIEMNAEHTRLANFESVLKDIYEDMEKIREIFLIHKQRNDKGETYKLVSSQNYTRQKPSKKDIEKFLIEISQKHKLKYVDQVASLMRDYIKY